MKLFYTNTHIQTVMTCFLGAMVLLTSGCMESGKQGVDEIYLDYERPVDERVHDLMSRMTLEEKATFLNHRAPEIERFGIISDKWNQCLHGVVWDRPTTMFPISTAAAATWNPELMYEVSSAISDEARAIYNGWHQSPDFEGDKKGLIYRSPVINISRNPYWGRINETFSEDPFLTGRIGVAYVKGLQGNHPKYRKLVSTLKHYAVNNVEANRQSLSVDVSERMLHEYWLPHFKECIIEGGAQSIMASYNAINGTPNNINKLLLTDILKDQWGFDGFVVSDLGGVKSMVEGHEKGQMTYEIAVAESLNAGVDFSDKEFMEYIPNAVRQGLLPESRLDDAVFRVMKERFLLGEFDPAEQVPFSTIPMSIIGSEKHLQLALKEAQESMVLLTNKNNLLPFDKTKLNSIAVIGPHADIFVSGGYSGLPTEVVTPIEGIKNSVGKGVKVTFAKGCEPPPPSRWSLEDFPEAEWLMGEEIADENSALAEAVKVAKAADAVLLFVGTTLGIEREGHDRESLHLPENQEKLIDAVMEVNPNTVVVLMNAGPLAIPKVKEKAPAILEAWWAGQQGAPAIADVIFGDVNPGGKLPYTVYASEAHVPSQDEYDITKGFTYMYLEEEALFPFGHGLSYTKFDYANLQVSKTQVSEEDELMVSVDVTNSGERAGDEVVQFYVHDVESSVKRPIKELRGFERVPLEPGETKTITFSLPAGKLSFYDEKSHDFKVEPGEFTLMVGSSSEDIRQQTQIEVVKK
ncbi:glycoside hydrolase family 3 C-terminal domain-containing protein [Muricauda sp. CAU 1633]|uniref:glycoside hydrolase family 3 C-terminal domain-containing protein n=1 Tax=Allomuricauda sp. CAU 1633 TaxID=2816036 RepID=UPI001A8F082A|nr:glycoside hydrolase family 3 C-terminal domain-containing protein [Muricauda sp. CAU 1633]MBO0321524.1 glycoside hydrolase family 3 C-terminal domain-containing protein [Muricauda sp. CAU 1633]